MKIDYNSNINQDIKGKFIEREVYCCITDIVTDLIETKKINIYDYIETVIEFDGINYSYNEFEQLKNNNPEIDYSDCYEHETEIFEYWAVSNFLAEKLKEKGYIIIDDYFVSIWGREITGQAILLDLSISQICEDMKILDPLPNSKYWYTK